MEEKGLAFFGAVLFTCFAASVGSELCVSGEYWSTYRYKYYKYTRCTYGCCGYVPNQYCCGVNVGIIVGGVFAGILGISLLVALICCCIKHTGHKGRVVRPVGQPALQSNVTVVNTASGQYAGGYYPQQPMGLQQQTFPPPPAYTYTNPAFPPQPQVQPQPQSQPPAYTASGTNNPFENAANTANTAKA